MSQGLVEGGVPVLVGHVQVAILTDKQSNDLGVLTLHGLEIIATASLLR